MEEGEGRACNVNVKFVDLLVEGKEGFERVARVVVKVRWVSVWGVRRADLDIWKYRTTPRAEEVERVVRNMLEVGGCVGRSEVRLGRVFEVGSVQIQSPTLADSFASCGLSSLSPNYQRPSSHSVNASVGDYSYRPTAPAQQSLSLVSISKATRVLFN